MFADTPAGPIQWIEGSELVLGGFEGVCGEDFEAGGKVEEGDGGAARAAGDTVDHDFEAAGSHFVDEVEDLVYHGFFDEEGDGEVEEAEHEPVFPAGYEVFGVAFGSAPEPVAYGFAVIGFFAGVDYGPAGLG